MRRMLGTTGADDTMKLILSGDLNDDQIAALQTLVANPDKTLGTCFISLAHLPVNTKLCDSVTGQKYLRECRCFYTASLTSYKYLLDTQATLQATVDNVNAIGGSTKIRDAVLDTLLPIMQQIESTIDKIGDDFTVQKFDPAEYVLFFARMATSKPLTSCSFSSPFNSQDGLLKLLEDSSDSVSTLQDLNVSFASSTTAAIKNVQKAFNGLAESVKTAAAIPNAPFPKGVPVTCAA